MGGEKRGKWNRPPRKSTLLKGSKMAREKKEEKSKKGGGGEKFAAAGYTSKNKFMSPLPDLRKVAPPSLFYLIA